MNTASLQQAHDELLASKPEDASHDAETCPFCNGSFETASEGGDLAVYTDEDVKAAVAEAVAPLQARIAELETSQEQAAFDAKIAEATAALTAQIEELQTKLDAAVLEAETAKQELTNTVEYLTSVETEREAQVEFARLRDERIALVKEVASFPEDYVEANADRWAKMDAEAFESQVNDWKVISSRKPEESRIPAETAMQGGEAPATSKDGMGMVREMMDLTIRGNDPRRI